MTYLVKADLRCPHCGVPAEEQDARSPKSRPRPGDISMCWDCRNLGVFVETPDGLSLRVPTDAERDELERDPRVRAARGALAESYDWRSALDLWRGHWTVTR